MNNQIGNEVFYILSYKTSSLFYKRPNHYNDFNWTDHFNEATYFKLIDEIKNEKNVTLTNFNIIKVETTKTIIDINKIANQKLEDISN